MQKPGEGPPLAQGGVCAALRPFPPRFSWPTTQNYPVAQGRLLPLRLVPSTLQSGTMRVCTAL
jgi:hypothetical protein